MGNEKRQLAPLNYELPDHSQFLVLDPEEETLDAQLLVQGFEAFNQATQKLQDYYRGIERKVDELNSELARKNRELEQNLLEKDRVKSHLNNIFESSALGIVVTDLQGEILSVNQKALRLLDKMAEEVRGLRLNEILGERVLPLRFTPEFMQSLQQGQEQEMTLRGGAGLSRQLRLHLSLMKSDQNEWLGLIVNIQDITDLRKLEEEAERKNRFTGMGQMAASIAHEIRNPLGSIELFTSLLRKEVQSDSSQQLVHHISSAVQSMNHIISNLLEYTKPRPVAREVIDLHKFLRVNLSFFEQLVEYNDVEMRTDFLATNTKIRGEAELLKQVFHNILINAIQAMVEEGEIRLTTRNVLTDNRKMLERFTHVPLSQRRHGMSLLQVSVEDTGTGMSQEVRKRIFDPFFSTKERGTGLGLAIVHNIIESHGAIIDVESEVDQGTCFTLLFPVAHDDEEIPVDEPTSTLPKERVHY